MGSRVQGAASACIVVSGLIMCGVGGALAIAEPPPGNPGSTHSTDVPGAGSKADSDGSGGSGLNSDGKGETGASGASGETATSGKNANGGNPGNGNCGNEGSNGNAQHCGGGTTRSSTSGLTSTKTTTQTTETLTTTKTTTTQTTTTQTTSSGTTSSGTTSSGTTSSKTETSQTSQTTETTTSTTTTSPPGLPGPGAGGGGSGGAVAVPSGRLDLPTQMLLPPELMPPVAEPSVLDVLPGVGAAAEQLPATPISLPVIVAPAASLGGGDAAPPAAPRNVIAEPMKGLEPLPANVGSNAPLSNSSYRIGYGEYLRTAGLSQVAALAVPGVTGILVLTGAGGLVGYRQAKAGHAVRTRGTARFVD
jgi:hypothetical protein